MDAKDRAVELVRQLLEADHNGEAEADQIHAELSRLLPDPALSDLINWPSRHPKAAGFDPAELTPQRIVELAMEYRPTAL